MTGTTLINADDVANTLPNENAVLVGRVWREGRIPGPSVILVYREIAYDITPEFPTMSSFFENPDAWDWEKLSHEHENLGDVHGIIENTLHKEHSSTLPLLLAPCDIQALKACGVTFVASLIERVIEEKAAGHPERAASIRERLSEGMGDIARIKAGTEDAARLREKLMEQSMWSQYMEVGIGPDAEIFTKAQILSAAGHLAPVGIRPDSIWNNPEPEIVLVVNSQGKILGATLGNDVNLRDVEGRSALLLGQAKDNNGSCAIGPFIRVFDQDFALEDIEKAVVTMRIRGEDGYRFSMQSAMTNISRAPAELVRQAINAHHAYPDGLMLFLGTMFAPTDDRGEKGQGFTHKAGDVVSISSPGLGSLINIVGYTDNIPRWEFGVFDLMRNLARRKLL